MACAFLQKELGIGGEHDEAILTLKGIEKKVRDDVHAIMQYLCEVPWHHSWMLAPHEASTYIKLARGDGV